MKQGYAAVMLTALTLGATGCDGIFDLDNQDPPSSPLTGRVVFNGEPVGVRIPSGSAQVLLWQTQPSFPVEGSIPVYLSMDGTFSARVFDGTYDVALLEGGGPWQNDATRRPVTVNGATTFDIPVQPYYTIDAGDNAFTFIEVADATVADSVRATFRVAKHVTDPQVEYVGLYVGQTTFVDRNRAVVTNNGVRERTRAQIQTQLNGSASLSDEITITVPLPLNIRVTPSPDDRTKLYVRVGVKTVGVPEMAYTPVSVLEM